MKKFILLLIAAFLLASCSSNPPGPRNNVANSGVTKTESRDVTGFKKISVANNFGVEVTVGEGFSVTVEGDENLLGVVSTTVADDTLSLSLTQKFSSSTKITAKITLPELTELEIEGRSTANINGVKGDSFKITSKGATGTKISGEVKAFEVHALVASRINAEALKTISADVEALGLSIVAVSPSETLKAVTKNNSSVVYTGDPKVEKDTSDTSSVKKKE